MPFKRLLVRILLRIISANHTNILWVIVKGFGHLFIRLLALYEFLFFSKFNDRFLVLINELVQFQVVLGLFFEILSELVVDFVTTECYVMLLRLKILDLVLDQPKLGIKLCLPVTVRLDLRLKGLDFVF